MKIVEGLGMGIKKAELTSQPAPTY